MKLTLYMFKESVQEFSECYLDVDSDGKKLKLIEINSDKTLDGVEDYKILYLKGKQELPSWVSFIDEYIDPAQKEKLFNKVDSALILLKVQLEAGFRFFATSGGYGYHLINEDNVEPNFGLYTALKTLSAEKIKLIDSVRLGMQTRQKREVCNISSNVNEFDFECDSEILKMISGDCKGSPIADKISGTDNLKITGEIEFSGISEKCRRAFNTYKYEALPPSFRFIEYIQPVKDEKILAALNNSLADAFFNRIVGSRISLAYPDMIDLDNCAYFKLSGLGRLPATSEANKMDDVTLDKVYEYLDLFEIQQENQVNVLKSILKVHGFDGRANKSHTTSSLYSCLTYETNHQDKAYVFNNKKWYSVHNDYLSYITEYISSKIVRCLDGTLKPWYKAQYQGKPAHVEGDYNKSYSSDSEYLVLDRQNFHLGPGFGKSQIELADIFHRPTNRLFCVKKSLQSGLLSHLFSQGSVSAELFKKEPKYRQKFIDSLTAQWSDEEFRDSLCDDLKFIFAIGAKSTGDVVESLPFFSKLTLLKHAKTIQAFGFDVEVLKVEMIDTEAPVNAE